MEHHSCERQGEHPKKEHPASQVGNCCTQYHEEPKFHGVKNMEDISLILSEVTIIVIFIGEREAPISELAYGPKIMININQ